MDYARICHVRVHCGSIRGCSFCRIWRLDAFLCGFICFFIVIIQIIQESAKGFERYFGIYAEVSVTWKVVKQKNGPAKQNLFCYNMIIGPLPLLVI